ncbi:MAG TPA: ABC transporter permease, partial [Bellilinea sp.]|nr:ABC transporter permease [Bellilinea sp.]
MSDALNPRPVNLIDENSHLKKEESPFKLFVSRFTRNKPATFGFILFCVLLIVCIAAPLITTYSPTKQSLSQAQQPPSEKHIFGTDYLGRDLGARLLYGGRLSLTIGFLAVALGLVIGIPLGALSGYYGGWIDIVLQRIADILLSFPSFLLALTLVAILGVGVKNVVISVGILAIPSFMRLIRGSVLSIREMLYTEAAQCIGATNNRIIFKHILPNAMAPVIIQASLNMGYAISTAAGLGFLGLGVPPGTPEWGMMLGEAKNY